MDCGLSGNLLSLDFDKYGFLAQHSWWSHLWRLVSSFGVELSLRSECYYPLPRKRDVGLMNILVDGGNFSEYELIRLNRVRHFKGVFVLSDLLHCDGFTLREEMLSYARLNYRDDYHKYPIQYPTKADIKLWRTALFTIFSSRKTLPSRLGKYLRPPALRYYWTFSTSTNLLYYCSGGEMVDVYVPSASDPSTRRNARHFTFSRSLPAPPPGTHYASLSYASTTDAVLHSITPIPLAVRSMSLQEVLDSLPDQSLWKRFTFEGDGSWILHAILRGSLEIVHDGSYMASVSATACSCGFVLYCTHSGNRAVGSFAEESDHADNYRGEWLGSVGALLVLVAVMSTTSLSLESAPPVHAHCDNMGVISHHARLSRSLPEKQAQADLIRLCREYRRRIPFLIKYHHVDGHLDRLLRWDQLTRVQQENCLMDDVAKSTLLDSVINDDFISGYFPHENVVVSVAGSKVTGSCSSAIGNAWGFKVARELFHSRKIVDRKHFRLIYWDGMESCMRSFTQMFRVWVTKHVSHFCGTNRHLSRLDGSVVNVCPSCGSANEDTSHIVRCKSSGRTSLYEDSVGDILTWLVEADTADELVNLIKHYLLGRGDVQASSLLAVTPPSFHIAIRQLDLLGFDSFVEGRVPTVLVDLQRTHYSNLATQWTAERWAKGLVHRLLHLTHRQWLYRNAVVHFRGPDGYTSAEHAAIVSKLEDFLWVDPLDLLSRDRGLLDEDFEFLGSSPAAAEMWIAAMEVAISAAEHSRRRTIAHPPRRRYTTGPDYSPKAVVIVPIKDSEGSIRYKRRRRRK